MKKLFTLLLAIVASVGMMFAEIIEHVQIDDLYYNLDTINKTAEVTYNHWQSWDNYSGLTTITIPASVTYNEESYSVTSIGNSAFYRCTHLASVTIPNSVSKIEWYVFSFCANLTSIVVDNENAIFDSRNNCNAVIETATNKLVCGCKNTIIPNDVTCIGGHAFAHCNTLTSLIIPNGVTSIESEAFWGSGLTSIELPNSVTSIGYQAFYSCNSLTSVTIPNSIEIIPGEAFRHCGLTSIELPNSVKIIKSSAFAQCGNLTSVTIPNSVTSIGIGAFWMCTGLTSVICKATTPPTMEEETVQDITTTVFYDVDCSQIPLYVPAESVDTYKAADQWKEFNPILPIEEGIEQISQESKSNSQKLIKDGNIFILRGDKVYTLTGKEL